MDAARVQRRALCRTAQQEFHTVMVRAYRLQCWNNVGTWMQNVGQGWLVFAYHGSSKRRGVPVAEIGGKLPALLGLEDFHELGAGRGIPHLPTWRLARRAVA